MLEYHKQTTTKEGWAMVKTTDTGSDEQSVNVVSLQGNTVEINAADQVSADVIDNGTLRQSIAHMASSPEYAWMEQIQNQYNVDWQEVNEVSRHWNDTSRSLTPAAAVVIAITVTVITYGAVSGVGAGVMALGTTGTTTGAMANAAFATLATQASISLVNNQGDLGAVLKDL